MRVAYIFYWICLLASCIFIGCEKDSPEPYITEIIDYTNDEVQHYHLNYDNENRLISFGDAFITYGKNEITLGNITDFFELNTLFEGTYYLTKEKVAESKIACEEKIGGKIVPVNKETRYFYFKQSIVIDAKFYNIGRDTLLKACTEVYEFSPDGKLLSMIYSDTDAGKKIANFDYGSNIRCIANLNLQACTLLTNSSDIFFSLLLNVVDLSSKNILPDKIEVTDFDGERHVFTNAYYMENDNLTRWELIKDYDILIKRLEFNYRKEKDEYSEKEKF